jgi:hypothetical protein
MIIFNYTKINTQCFSQNFEVSKTNNETPKHKIKILSDVG